MSEQEKGGRAKSALALIGKTCPNCGLELQFLENPAIIFPDDLRELDWDYIKNLALVSKVLAVCLRCGFVASESLTPVEASGVYAPAEAPSPSTHK